ncbi:MAG: alpha/beta fold hydrolase [Nitrospira sp. CR1.3]|nr:alpha/beta fold hydrolase [Nitrospira sp. CR1.3]
MHSPPTSESPIVTTNHTHQKAALILIHGFISDHSCWDPLRRLFESDSRITGRFEVECFEYPTSLLGKGQEDAHPTLRQIAIQLIDFLSHSRFAGRHLVLVGHSQGGLVIQAYFMLLLEARQARQLARIRQAIFIATPNLGSIFLDRTRRLTDQMLKFVSGTFLHPQERLLRALQPEIMEIQKLLLGNIVSAGTHSDQAFPIPLQCFYGSQDKVVLDVSAQSFFTHEVCIPLVAGHMDIIKPRDMTDERYAKLVDALLQPIGHANVVEVERYETCLRVEPYEGRDGVEVSYGNHHRTVFTDNRAFLSRRMVISRKNRCRNSCDISYLTNAEGFVRPVPEELLDKIERKERTRYENHGREFNFVFSPLAGETYDVTIEILRGFEAGDRRIHFHLGACSYHQILTYTLDLTAYLQAGYRLTQLPRLYFEEGETHRCEQIWQGPSLDAMPSDQEGLWRWELHDVREGAVGLAWDLDR